MTMQMTMQTTKVNLDLSVSHLDTAWQVEFLDRPAIRVWDPPIRMTAPPVASIQLNKPAIQTFGFCFFDEQQDSNHFDNRMEDGPIPARSPAKILSRDATSRTARPIRVHAPNDVIKLKDRLYYALQPPLEYAFSTNSLEFPFRPFPYQWEGVAFLYPRHAAMLADEMGLGKTMQAITSIRLLIFKREIRNVLLVCPKPLVSNWKREFAQWAPELSVTTIEGNRQRREWLWKVREQPVKIANYELVARDQPILCDRPAPFDLVLLDEAQRIKNRTCGTSRAVRSIPRLRSWALTGTPIENSSEDLCGIFEFLRPGVLRADLKPRRLRQATRDYLLRRTKDEVLDDLPPILCRDAELSLTPAQRDTYSMAEGEGVLKLTDMGHQVTVQHVFELILRLKQICNFDPATRQSSKYERLAADLDEVTASGAKAIVFSQWVKTLRTLRDALQPHRPLEYHGKIPSAKRDGVIESFQNDDSRHVLLMSYGAGGVGLNLQFASYVFLFDRWWNPAVEDQAISRAHRIGAVGPVTVTRFLMMGTIEERIHEVLQQKRELFHTILDDRDAPRNLGLSQQDIFGLFDLNLPQESRDNAA